MNPSFGLGDFLWLLFVIVASLYISKSLDLW